jgi:hypothetical protein
LLALDLDREQLGRFVRLFSLRSDFGNPRKLRWRFFVENIDLVVAHSLLSHNYLFRAIDDEVASLVVPTVLAVFDSLVLIEVLELAKV